MLNSSTELSLRSNIIALIDCDRISGGNDSNGPHVEIQGSFGGNGVSSIQGGASVTAHIPISNGMTISPTVVVDTTGHVLGSSVRFDFPFLN